MDAVVFVGVLRFECQAVADGGFAAPSRRFDHRVKIDRRFHRYVVADGLEVDLGTLGVEDVMEDFEQFEVLRKLCQHQADEVVADDEIVHLGDLGKFAVTQVEHLGDDGEGRLVLPCQVAQVQEGDEGFGVGMLGFERAVRQHDDVVVIVDVQAVEQGAVRRIAGPHVQFLVF